MKSKRKVSSNLGHTQHRVADSIYANIGKTKGLFRKCPFYRGKKYPQFNSHSHDKFNPGFPNPNVPIEEFDFAKKKNGEWGLQAYCKVCYKEYRSARIANARKMWVKKNGVAFTDADIRHWYRENVGPTMICSVCRRSLPPTKFRISKSMEKGLHNICLECSASGGNSVREQILLSDGDWDSWKKAVMVMRKQKRVKCSGWPRSVSAGACKKYDSGKRMHADHQVPLRAGGLNDGRNFQPLCSACNVRKLHQIDPRLKPKEIRELVSSDYSRYVKNRESVTTIERRLKAAVFNRISKLAKEGKYESALRQKKKEVNGQWNVNRAFRKGLEWLRRGDIAIDDQFSTDKSLI